MTILILVTNVKRKTCMCNNWTLPNHHIETCSQLFSSSRILLGDSVWSNGRNAGRVFVPSKKFGGTWNKMWCEGIFGGIIPHLMLMNYLLFISDKWTCCGTGCGNRFLIFNVRRRARHLRLHPHHNNHCHLQAQQQTYKNEKKGFPFNDLIEEQVNMFFLQLINSIMKIAKIQSPYYIIVQVCWWKRRQNGGKYDVTIIHEVQEDFTIKHREEKNGIPKKRKKISNDIIDKNVTRNPPPKILTARKRTKNGVLKKPTELWLV